MKTLLKKLEEYDIKVDRSYGSNIDLSDVKEIKIPANDGYRRVYLIFGRLKKKWEFKACIDIYSRCCENLETEIISKIEKCGDGSVVVDSMLKTPNQIFRNQRLLSLKTR